MSSALSTLSKAPNPQLLPGHRSINGLARLRVCVHCCVCALWMGLMQSTNSEYGSPYLAVCHFTSFFFLFLIYIYILYYTYSLCTTVHHIRGYTKCIRLLQYIFHNIIIVAKGIHDNKTLPGSSVSGKIQSTLSSTLF